MVGRRFLFLAVTCAFLVGFSGVARAQDDGGGGEDEAPAAEVADETPEGEASEVGDAEAGEASEAEESSDSDGAEAGEASEAEESGAEVEEAAPRLLPPPQPVERARFKLRKAPGRAVRASDIEARTGELSKLIEASEGRLKQLADRVLSGKIGRAGATIVYRNEMGSSFKLIRAVFALDGAPIFSQVDESGELGSREEIELFNGSIVPGEHRLSVSLEYRGHGFGIFSYLKGYRFKVRSSYAFTVQEGKAARVRVVGYEKGDQNTPLEERPDIRYVERLDSLSSSD